MKGAVSFVLVALMAGVLWGQEAKQDPKPPLSVRIVPTDFKEERGRSINLGYDTAHFHVVLTNISDKPLRLCNDTCSWGYFALSFEVKDESGKTTKVTKQGMPWSTLFAHYLTVPPGDHMVREVSFSKDEWENFVLPEKGKSVDVQMRAVFEIKPDDETKKKDVWTGKVVSPEETYTIYR